MSENFEKKRDKGGPSLLRGGDLGDLLKKKQGDADQGQEGDSGAALTALLQGADGSETAGKTKPDPAEAAKVLAHYAGESADAGGESKTAEKPARPYAIPKPSPAEKQRKRNAQGAGDEGDWEGEEAAKGNEKDAAAKQQGFA